MSLLCPACTENMRALLDCTDLEPAPIPSVQGDPGVDASVATAQRDLALGYLRRMVDLVARTGGHQWSEDQALMRGAVAVIAELEGSGP
jgi:hypothetical protein